MAIKIPFISNAISRGSKAVNSFRLGNKMEGIHHSVGAVSDVAFPVFIGNELKKSYKDSKNMNNELKKIHNMNGFKKQSEYIKMALLGSIAKGFVGAGKFIAKHPKATALTAGGTALGGAGVLSAKEISDQAKKKQFYGQKTRYGGQFS